MLALSANTPDADRTRRPGARRPALTVAVVLAFLAVLFVGASLYTDRPDFCRSCHEMQPFYDAWASGEHKDRWCVDCHTDNGYIGRMGHKFVALREVAVHFFGTPSFPQAAPPTVPDERCTACHEHVVIKKPASFDHQRHAEKGPCQACHASDGHPVTRASLAAAGVLSAQPSLHTISTTFTIVGGGNANIAGHVKVTCTRCHGMRETGCARCHALPAGKHPRAAACEQCHSAGPKWQFAHPTGVTQCQPCHQAPANHYRAAIRPLALCGTCHHNPGGSWKFGHPGPSAPCRDCHTPPAKHFAGQCSACHHRTGATFAFSHPSVEEHGYRSFGCSKCHPASYTKASCTCHDQGKVEDDDD